MRRATQRPKLTLLRLGISIHALLAESDAQLSGRNLLQYQFLSTLSLRRATDVLGGVGQQLQNFYPRSPCGERPLQVLIAFFMPEFLSTLSLRRATTKRPTSTSYWTKFLSTLSLRRATHLKPCVLWSTSNFYPRSPCGERRNFQRDLFGGLRFLSTLSLRRATPRRRRCTAFQTYFYPRSPCGERLTRIDIDAGAEISIHALLAESDGDEQSGGYACIKNISIHALLAESDAKRTTPRSGRSYFYPRSPCGERLQLSVPVAGGKVISIHALLAESDPLHPSV